MSNREKFLTALKGRWGPRERVPDRPRPEFSPDTQPVNDEPATSPVSASGTDNEAGRLTTSAETSGDNQLNLQFLSRHTIDPYIRHLERGAGHYLAGFDVYDPDHDWNSEAFPLGLCEFLAYKTALAYHSPARIERNLLDEHPGGISYFRFFNSRGRHGDTQAYGFVLGDTAYLVFRGTEFFTWADWATDFDSTLTTRLDDERYRSEAQWIGPQQPGRHTGFAVAWGHVRDQVTEWLDHIVAGNRARRVVLSGHSLGGALAQIAAHDLASSANAHFEIGAVVTFGAPLVGDQSFKESYEDALKLGRRTIRIEAPLDLITIVTLAPFSYRYVGRRWHIDKRPAYSRWRMYFFTPLLGPDEEAERKTRTKKPPPEQGSQKTTSNSNPITGLLLHALWFTIRLLRRAQAAHSVNQRYALFLSVLSYQGIRRHFGDDYDRAHARLLDHLAYIRGRNGKLFGAARSGPIRVKSKSDAEWLQRAFKHFIV